MVKKPKKFYPLDINYAEEEVEPGQSGSAGDKPNFSDAKLQEKLVSAAASNKSKLKPEILKLMSLLFDIKRFKKELKEYELDLEKMPLGKISTKQINTALQVLKDAEEYINSENCKENPNVGKFTDFTNKFYTLIPHDTGMSTSNLINSIEIVQKKVDMLNQMIDVERAMSVMSKLNYEDSDGANSNLYDQHYEKLNCEIDLLDPENDDYKTIEKMTKNTHAKTHNNYTLEIENIFTINRANEKKNFKPFKKKLKKCSQPTAQTKRKISSLSRKN